MSDENTILTGVVSADKTETAGNNPIAPRRALQRSNNPVAPKAIKAATTPPETMIGVTTGEDGHVITTGNNPIAPKPKSPAGKK